MQGVPLKVAFRGIDRYCERYYAKGPRRRPVRIEFCEADILDLFDAWRRAVGVTRRRGGRAGASRRHGCRSGSQAGAGRARGACRGPAGERPRQGTRSASFLETLDALVRELEPLVDRRGRHGASGGRR
jgi:hypothetical protein